MKKIIALIFLLVFISSSALASFTLVISGSANSATGTLGKLVSEEIEQYLGEPIIIRYIPGGRGIPGFNKFHNELMYNNKTFFLAQGGNAISFLLDEGVDFNYADYSLVGLMNLDIVVGKKIDDKNIKTDNWVMAGIGGAEPDGMAVAMMLIGPTKNYTIDEYLSEWNKRMKWVNGVESGGESALGFQRGEFDVVRFPEVGYWKYFADKTDVELWFTHGVYDVETKTQKDNPNIPNTQFEDKYFEIWGEYPQGELYEAYKLLRNWRDVFQKVFLVKNDNPNINLFRQAFINMINNPDSMRRIISNAGEYEWIVGDDLDDVLAQMLSIIQRDPLKNSVLWGSEAYRYPTIFKEGLLK